jgi:23S rRNA pseudouridine1911/1915/1917 synthase
MDDSLQPEIIYFDNHLVIVNKPAGLATHEDGVHEFTLRQWVEDWVCRQFSKSGRAFVVPAHRLDKATSGLVVFAKTDKALSRLAALFRHRSLKKLYRAKVTGQLPESGRLEDWLDRRGSQAFISKESPQAQQAILFFKRLQVKDAVAELEIELETGRHHQIRIQLSSRGWPILGDRRYEGKGLNREGILLHHYSIEFIHPVSREPLIFVAPLPKDWDLF